MEQKSTTLHYTLYKPRVKITMNLFEAEYYEAAVVVQQLVGNLVYYSNQGRYEPRLAESWRKVDKYNWEFKLKPDLYCENDEPITAQSYKVSLQRTIKKVAQKGMVPILNKLVGFDDFIKEGDQLEGIKAQGDSLTFTFDEEVKSGLVQVLSFVPFGYICKDNLNDDGTWKDNSKFIASGPYKLKQMLIGEKYHLIKNDKWKGDYNETSPDELVFNHSLPNAVKSDDVIILDSARQNLVAPSGLREYRLVPEYINPVLLGNTDKGYFSDINNRENLKYLIQKHKQKLPEKWGPHVKSHAFYPNQQLIHSSQDQPSAPFTKQNESISIEGEEPNLSGDTPRDYVWQVLKPALDEGGLKYKFANNPPDWKNITSKSYDVRMRGASIGGGIEVWGLGIVFCSDLGINFPDPSGKVCKLIKDYEQDKLNFDDLSQKFFATVEQDMAILPVSHYGIRLFLSDRINSESISPTLNVIKFDQLGIK